MSLMNTLCLVGSSSVEILLLCYLKIYDTLIFLVLVFSLWILPSAWIGCKSRAVASTVAARGAQVFAGLMIPDPVSG